MTSESPPKKKGTTPSLRESHSAAPASAPKSGQILRWTIHVRTVSANIAYAGEHWSKRAKRAAEQRWVVGATIGNRIRGLLPCTVTLTRVAPRGLDDDNLLGALKSVRDQVAQCIGVDDRDQRIDWRYAQERGAPREYAVRIEVTTVLDRMRRANVYVSKSKEKP